VQAGRSDSPPGSAGAGTTRKDLTLKDLPASGASFKQIISDGLLYADKTGHICRLIQFKSCFLSRPRCFWKTILVDTVAELFKGDMELFTDLETASFGYRFAKLPVIRLDMSRALSEPPGLLITDITDSLRAVATRRIRPSLCRSTT
jgi:hypothetical protein